MNKKENRMTLHIPFDLKKKIQFYSLEVGKPTSGVICDLIIEFIKTKDLLKGEKND